jgi:hypothetical protein
MAELLTSRKKLLGLIIQDIPIIIFTLIMPVQSFLYPAISTVFFLKILVLCVFGKPRRTYTPHVSTSCRASTNTYKPVYSLAQKSNLVFEIPVCLFFLSISHLCWFISRPKKAYEHVLLCCLILYCTISTDDDFFVPISSYTEFVLNHSLLLVS